MRTLYIKQKVFSFRDRFNVKDAEGNDCYQVTGDLFTLGRRLHVCDMEGNEVIYIQQKVMSFMPRYEVYVDGTLIATLVQEFSFLRPRFRIEGPGWHVEGSFWEHQYEVTDGDKPVVSIRKVLMSWGDSYELDVQDGVDERAALAVVLAIDCVNAARN